MAEDSATGGMPALDATRLLGFRNLAAVMAGDGDVAESAELAFNKRGAEVPTQRED